MRCFVRATQQARDGGRQVGEAAGISSLLSSSDELKCSKKKKKSPTSNAGEYEKKKSDALNQSAAGRGRRRVPAAWACRGAAGPLRVSLPALPVGFMRLCAPLRSPSSPVAGSCRKPVATAGSGLLPAAAPAAARGPHPSRTPRTACTPCFSGADIVCRGDCSDRT